MESPDLFSPLKIRSVQFRNRIGVSPMCQYSCQDGFATDWHLVHLGSRAVGGAGVVIAEATAVEARGRISPEDLGLWKDEHVPALARIAEFVRKQGAVAGIQLAHAGRKASTPAPWNPGKRVLPADGGWQPVAPSAIPFDPADPPPHELSREEIAGVTGAFVSAAQRALRAGFELIEIHAAHGYLLHEFLSPISNRRTDEYGGVFENRARLVLEVAHAIRAVWPAELPLFVRISATDWVDGGWDAGQSVALARLLAGAGVDLIDCSSGGLTPHAKVPVGPGYQVQFAERVRKESGLATAAVGLITEPAQASEIITSGQADFIFLARQMLRDPYWPLHAARKLSQAVTVPVQYARAF
jgi:2,4-dienoyl-CoA reductase-like NADH-dependent reductase (Old Yellow Enzyme family)